jgi:Chaperone of endosialidase
MSTLGSYEIDRISYTSGATNFATIVATSVGFLQFSSTGAGTTVQLQNITDPVLAQDAATKFYVDSLSQGLSWKDACMLYSSTSVDLSSAPLTFDGIAPVTGARILINAQTNVVANGIYIWGTAGIPMARASDFPSGGSLSPTTNGTLSYSATAVFVQQGSTYADTAWVETFDSGLIGTTTVTFVQFSATGGAAAGTAAGQIQYRGTMPGQFAASTEFSWTTATNTLNLSATTNTSSINMSTGLATLTAATGGTTLVSANSLTLTGTSSTISATSGTVNVSNPTEGGSLDSFNGRLFQIQSQTYTMTNNTVSFTTNFVFNSIAPSALGSTTSTVTGNAINLFVDSPIAATSQTFNNTYAIYANGNVNVTGLLSVTSLSVTAPINFNNLTVSTLTVNGPSNLNGPVTVIGPLSVTSNSTFGTLSATSAVINNLSVTTLSVSGPANIVGPLVVTSNATFGTLSATSAVIGTLSVTSLAGAAPPTDSVQFNGGSNFFAGSSQFTWTTATNTLQLGSPATNGTLNVGNAINVIGGATTSAIVSSSTSTFTIDSTGGAAVSLFPTPTTQNIALGSNLTTGNINIGTTGTTGAVIIWSTQAASSQITGALQVKGGVGIVLDCYANRFRSASDAKYKTNIQPIENALELAEKIGCYTYNWKKSFRGYSPELEYGLVAQQLEEVGLGNFVGTDDEGKSVCYDAFIPISIKGLKELNDKFKELERRINLMSESSSESSSEESSFSPSENKRPIKLKLKPNNL